MSALKTLARMLGIGDHQAEDALHSERAARVAIGRRDFLAAGAALVTGAAFSDSVAGFLVQNDKVFTCEAITIEVMGRSFPGIAPVAFRYSLDGGRLYSAPRAIPKGPTVIPGTGLTVTFGDGEYRPGERYDQPTPLPPRRSLKRRGRA
jgi:hypothetical protein